VQEGRLVLGAWGSLARHKGIDLLLDALAESSERARMELHLAGAFESASYQRELERRARASKVHFHGAFESEDLAQHPVSDVHAFVSATRAHESYGLVLDEALALGLPRVIPDAPAFVERAGEGAGALLYESARASELARGLDRLLTDADLWPRLAREASAARERLPSPADVAEKHADLYRRAIALGAPDVEPAAWFEERMGRAALAEWDRALALRSAAELGLGPQEERP
jgi:glycosyltransferase involved in cell wall biosynthesis